MGEKYLIDEDIHVLESFECSTFGYSKLASINEARYLHLRVRANQKKHQSH